MRFRGALFAAMLVGVSSDAGAHLRFPKLKGERTVLLDLSGPSIQLQYRIGFGAAVAEQERKQADRDGDFVVGALEANAAMDAKTANLLQNLSVCSGPKRDQVTCRPVDKRDVSRMDSEGWIPGPTRHLHVTWTFDLRESPENIGAVVVEDDYHVAGLEITDVTIKAPAHAKLVEAGDFDRPGGVSPQFTWIESARASGPRRIVAAWPGPPATKGVGVLLAAVAAILAAALWFWPRRPRNPDAAASHS